ncbi:MAG: hypothetical protein Q4E61_04150 [Alphaproteobacteria bacterium]|nr:hypothetical protein [Alphaproteobacteria bacterium]
MFPRVHAIVRTMIAEDISLKPSAKDLTKFLKLTIFLGTYKIKIIINAKNDPIKRPLEELQCEKACKTDTFLLNMPPVYKRPKTQHTIKLKIGIKRSRTLPFEEELIGFSTVSLSIAEVKSPFFALISCFSIDEKSILNKETVITMTIVRMA